MRHVLRRPPRAKVPDSRIRINSSHQLSQMNARCLPFATYSRVSLRLTCRCWSWAMRARKPWYPRDSQISTTSASCHKSREQAAT